MLPRIFFLEKKISLSIAICLQKALILLLTSPSLLLSLKMLRAVQHHRLPGVTSAAELNPILVPLTTPPLNLTVKHKIKRFVTSYRLLLTRLFKQKHTTQLVRQLRLLKQPLTTVGLNAIPQHNFFFFLHLGLNLKSASKATNTFLLQQSNYALTLCPISKPFYFLIIDYWNRRQLLLNSKHFLRLRNPRTFFSTATNTQYNYIHTLLPTLFYTPRQIEIDYQSLTFITLQQDYYPLYLWYPALFLIQWNYLNFYNWKFFF